MTASPPTEPLNLGLPLYIPYRAMEARVFEALAEAGFDDFTPAQARVFQRLAPGGSRLTELAEQAQITKQSAGSSSTSSNAPGTYSACPIPATPRPSHSGRQARRPRHPHRRGRCRWGRSRMVPLPRSATYAATSADPRQPARDHRSIHLTCPSPTLAAAHMLSQHRHKLEKVESKHGLQDHMLHAVVGVLATRTAESAAYDDAHADAEHHALLAAGRDRRIREAAGSESVASLTARALRREPARTQGRGLRRSDESLREGTSRPRCLGSAPMPGWMFGAGAMFTSTPSARA